MEERDELKTLFDTLEERDRTIMTMRYLDGRTQSETAAAVEMTPAEVSRRERMLLVWLRRKLLERM